MLEIRLWWIVFFLLCRLKPNKQKALKSDLKEIDQHINLIKAPGSQQQDSEKMKVLVSSNKPVQNEAMEEWFCGNIWGSI